MQRIFPYSFVCSGAGTSEPCIGIGHSKLNQSDSRVGIIFEIPQTMDALLSKTVFKIQNFDVPVGWERERVVHGLANYILDIIFQPANLALQNSYDTHVRLRKNMHQYVLKYPKRTQNSLPAV